MYIRWQTRPTKRAKYGSRRINEGAIWSLVLVESIRVNGKPRQRHVACLGTISEFDTVGVCRRGFAWDRLIERLDRLSNQILPEGRQRIEAAFAERVPRITNEEYDECVRGRAAWREGIKAFALALRRRGRGKGSPLSTAQQRSKLCC